MKIRLEYENNEYILEYTRRSVETMEKSGFVIDEIQSKPVTMIPQLFAGAFIKNHTGIKRKLVEEIYDYIPQKGELIATLGEMYMETVATLADEPEESVGNAQWAVMK